MYVKKREKKYVFFCLEMKEVYLTIAPGTNRNPALRKSAVSHFWHFNGILSKDSSSFEPDISQSVILK